MDWNKFLIDLVNVLTPLVFAVISYGVAVAIKALKDRTKNENLKEYIKLLDGVVWDVVNELEQTVVKGLKNKAKDGKLTKEDASSILNDACKLVKEELPIHAEIFLTKVYSDLERVIISKIEAEVKTSFK